MPSHQPWDDLGGESVHLVELVEERIEQDHLRPNCGDLVQAGHAILDGPGDGDGGEVGHPEVAVPAFEGIGDPVPGLVGVVVNGDVDPLGEGENAGVAPLLVQLVPDDPGVLGERAVVDDPAPMKPCASRTARASALGWLPPNQIGGCGCWTGLGSIAALRNCQNRPSKSTRG
jgi:hypothetical protein